MESDFKRGTEELDITFPLYNHLHGFLQAFSGYGQNLISFNHYTNAFGVGISLTSRESRRFK
jgi:phospholipase A1